jgi:phage-related minor tail protein
MRPPRLQPEECAATTERTGDRRQARRCRVEFEVVEERGPAIVRAQARDVSPTGIQIEADPSRGYLTDAIVPLSLRLPGRQRPLQTDATVVWVRGRRAGFEFAAMPDVDRLEIAEMVDRLGRG